MADKDAQCKMVDTVAGSIDAVNDLMKEKVVAVDAEGVHLGKTGPLTLLQVAKLDGFVYLFNIHVEPAIFEQGQLRLLLQNKDIVKVFHSCSSDSAALKCQFDVMLNNVFDIQVAQFLIDRSEGKKLPNYRKLSDLCALYTEISQLEGKDDIQEIWYKTDGAYWAKDVFTPEMIKYACADVRIMIPEVYEKLKRIIEEKNLGKELGSCVQHELHFRWDDTARDNNWKKDVVKSLLNDFDKKYRDTALSDVTDEDDLNALRSIRVQEAKEYSDVVSRLRIEALREDLGKLETEILTKGDDFVPMGKHHHLVASGRKCGNPFLEQKAQELANKVEDRQKKCLVGMYNESTPVTFLTDYERRLIRRLPILERSHPVMKHLFAISIKADVDDLESQRKRFVQEGKRFSLPPGNVGLYRYFISDRMVPEVLKKKAKEFLNALQDAGIVEAPKPRQKNFNRRR